MKRKNLKVVSIVLMTVLTTMFMGCSIPSKSGYDVDFKYSKVYSGKLENPYAAEDVCEQQMGYKLYTIDDKNAVFEESYSYGDGTENVYRYTGTYSQDGNVITFEYVTTSCDESFSLTQYITVEKDKIVDVSSADTQDYAMYVGDYDLVSSEGNQCALTVMSDGIVEMTLNNTKYYGQICYWDDEHFNLTATDGGCENSVDWIVNFDTEARTFTYEEYEEYCNSQNIETYAKFTGTLTINGELGLLNVELEEDGGCSANVNYNGQTIKMTGYYYLNEDESAVWEIDLYDENSVYSLNLYLEDIGEEYMNYSGTLSLSLSAG